MRFIALALLSIPAIGASGASGVAQRAGPASPSGPLQSAAIIDPRYEVQFDKSTASRRELRVSMRFTTGGKDPVLLSFPAWTPGAYEISNYGRWVTGFVASGAGKPLVWDKLDFDTWRVLPNGATDVSVSFTYTADQLDNAKAWAKPDFVFFNGTNVLPFPEGRGYEFGASVTIKTEPEWRIATGMAATGPRTYAAKNYHDLVDMPFFVGSFDLDSVQVVGKWTRLATYPAGFFTGAARSQFWNQVQRFLPPQVRVMGEVPYDAYTMQIVFDSSYGGGSALEHQNSHMGIYTPYIIGNATLPSITAHEFFHLWNVKRMRPAELVPYRYDRPQPTPWLWVSEGITDYYADLALVRGGVIDSSAFLSLTTTKIENVAALTPTALEDASLSTWIEPLDGTQYLYYDKGSLAGFLLDVMIRDASDNASSLDEVMRQVYTSTFKAGRGFSGEDWWSTVSRAAGGRSFADFNARYIDGRDPYPWATTLPLAGLRLRADTIREPRIGVYTVADSSGAAAVSEVEPAGAAAEAGIRPGDILVSIGDIAVNATFGARFRQRYAGGSGETVPVVVRRDGQPLTLSMRVRMVERIERSVVFDANASPKALRIRKGILTGTN